MTSRWASETAKLSEDDTTWPKDKKALVLIKLKEYEDIIATGEQALLEKANEIAALKEANTKAQQTSTPNVITSPILPEGHKATKFDSSAPKYYGRIDENPEELITLINCNFRMAGITKENRIYAISNCVLGAAQSHYLRYLAETAKQNRNIDDFFKELLTSGNNKLRAERAKDKLDFLKQTGSYDEYQLEFQKLASESKYSDEELRRRFKNGLRSQT
jgi:hypothetical protein